MVCFLLIYKKATEIAMLILYRATLKNVFISWKSFLEHKYIESYYLQMRILWILPFLLIPPLSPSFVLFPQVILKALYRTWMEKVNILLLFLIPMQMLWGFSLFNTKLFLGLLYNAYIMLIIPPCILIFSVTLYERLLDFVKGIFYI